MNVVAGSIFKHYKVRGIDTWYNSTKQLHAALHGAPRQARRQCSAAVAPPRAASSSRAPPRNTASKQVPDVINNTTGTAFAGKRAGAVATFAPSPPPPPKRIRSAPDAPASDADDAAGADDSPACNVDVEQPAVVERAGYIAVRTPFYLMRKLGQQLPAGVRAGVDRATWDGRYPASTASPAGGVSQRTLEEVLRAPAVMSSDSHTCGLAAAEAAFVYVGGTYPFSNIARCSAQMASPNQ